MSKAATTQEFFSGTIRMRNAAPSGPNQKGLPSRGLVPGEKLLGIAARNFYCELPVEDRWEKVVVMHAFYTGWGED